MDIQITLAGRGDLSARIYRQLRDAILDGRLRPGDRLPATRELAGQLGVSRNTVAAAYERLTAEGFLVARVGAGTYVEAVAERRSAGRRQAPRVARSRRLPGGKVSPPVGVRGWACPVAGARYDFGVGMPDPRCSRGRPGGAWCPPSCGRGRAAIAGTPTRAVTPVCETPSRATSASRGR